MSDQVIRISSEQGFAAAWANTAKPTTLNLCDFRIPRGLVVDLSKSYIAFNATIEPTVAGNFTATSNPINANFNIDGLVDGDLPMEVPNSALIRNASISCDKGQIESIRRVDTLRSTLWNLEHDAEDRKDDMNAFTAPKQIRGVQNQTSYFLDPVMDNINDGGGVITDRTSRNLARDVKVPLKSIFGIGEAEDWSTSKFGETRIHLETNWKSVKSYSLGGFEDTAAAFQPGAAAAVTWGQCEQIDLGASGSATDGTNNLVLSVAYTNPEQTCPFFVGQKILCTATSSNAGSSVTDVSATIATMTQLGSIVTLTTEAEWFVNPFAGAVQLTPITIKSDISAVVTNTVNRAELVLFTKPETMKTEDSYEYVTYSTEQDNGAGVINFGRGYVIEPSAMNIIVCLNKNNNILPVMPILNYRYAVNNEEMTGNRDVQLRTPLQYDRMTRCLDSTGMGTEWRNAQQAFFENAVAKSQLTSYDGFPMTVICETLMETERSKYVDLQIECPAGGDGVQEILIYKQHIRSI